LLEFALPNHLLQCVTDSFEIGNLIFHEMQFRLREVVGNTAGLGAIEIEQAGYVFQAEAEHLRSFDETDASAILSRIFAESRQGTIRFLQKPCTLVKADGFYTHSCGDG
jgi:hypothetical protein